MNAIILTLVLAMTACLIIPFVATIKGMKEFVSK